MNASQISQRDDLHNRINASFAPAFAGIDVYERATKPGVGVAAGCDLLIFDDLDIAEDQKIAACGSSYRGPRSSTE
ncbi:MULTISPECIES: hypothetical protein [Pseudomonas]